MNQEKIGQFIKDIRLKQNLSQKKFAEKYNVTYQAVSKWENGKNMPDITILKQICDDNNIDLDNLLEAKLTKSKKKKNSLIIIIIIIIILISIILFLIFTNKNESFSFKALSTSCDNFNLYGSIAYNNNTSSIYISNITYCGKEDSSKYSSISCTLYETNGNTKTQISNYKYDDEKEITLEEFLKDVQLHVHNYEKTCKTYKENSLHLEIDATDNNNNTTSYKIPLSLEEKCTN